MKSPSMLDSRLWLKRTVVDVGLQPSSPTGNDALLKMKMEFQPSLKQEESLFSLQAPLAAWHDLLGDITCEFGLPHALACAVAPGKGSPFNWDGLIFGFGQDVGSAHSNWGGWGLEHVAEPTKQGGPFSHGPWASEYFLISQACSLLRDITLRTRSGVVWVAACRAFGRIAPSQRRSKGSTIGEGFPLVSWHRRTIRCCVEMSCDAAGNG